MHCEHGLAVCLQAVEPIVLAGANEAGFTKLGSLRAQEAQVFQSGIAAGRALSVKLHATRSVPQGQSTSVLAMMNPGAVATLEAFKLRSLGQDGQVALVELGNCAGTGKGGLPVFIGIKNDGGVGSIDYSLTLIIKPCSNCTAVKCGDRMECVEATGM
jgi:hypothetical protein